jgi:hypothetical protein
MPRLARRWEEESELERVRIPVRIGSRCLGQLQNLTKVQRFVQDPLGLFAQLWVADFHEVTRAHDDPRLRI